MALPSLWRTGRGKGEALPSRDVWEPFGSLRRDMDRLFEDFSRDLGWGAPALAGAISSDVGSGITHASARQPRLSSA